MDNQNQQVPPTGFTAPPVKNSSNEIDNDKLWGVLAYILFLIPLLAVKRRSTFLNYHINQGIILIFVELIGYFGLGLLPWWVGIFMAIRWIWNLITITLLVIGIKNVLESKMSPLPVIGKLFTFLK